MFAPPGQGGVGPTVRMGRRIPGFLESSSIPTSLQRHKALSLFLFQPEAQIPSSQDLVSRLVASAQNKDLCITSTNPSYWRRLNSCRIVAKASVHKRDLVPAAAPYSCLQTLRLSVRVVQQDICYCAAWSCRAFTANSNSLASVHLKASQTRVALNAYSDSFCSLSAKSHTFYCYLFRRS
jgi:hypothetical protein